MNLNEQSFEVYLAVLVFDQDKKKEVIKMKKLHMAQWTGILFILGAVLVQIPFTLLGITFEYPQILRESPGRILTRFHEGGTGLILEWFAFAWVGLPILLGVVMLQRVLSRGQGQGTTALVKIATVLGVVALIVQIIGLLRWVFVVPVLASIYTSPNTSPATKEAVEVVFWAVHQFGGVLLGEHLGQLLIICWMALISLTMFKSGLFKPWLGIFGLVASGVYFTAQAELLETVIPNFPVIAISGVAGSLLWLAWMVLMGIFLVRAENKEVKEVPSKLEYALGK
ncbi:MAG: hypothetical protein JWP00_2586 [Chloroflexi bacterium]|nr:hypothetical protein [Chloroflexota bacterium]